MNYINHKLQLALLTGRCAELVNHEAHLADELDRIRKLRQGLEKALKTKVTHLQGMSEDDWEDFKRSEFDVEELQKFLRGDRMLLDAEFLVR